MELAQPANRQYFTPLALAILALSAALAAVPFWRELGELFDVWNIRPEYSHGILIPPIAAYLVWRERCWLSTADFHGSWTGVLVMTFGLLLWGAGELSTITTLVQYAFLVVVYGLTLALVGWAVFRRLWMPLLVLLFMVPLPAFFYSSLSLQLQLISSEIGVFLVRAAGISVFLEGNVIDLGEYQLQVAEACDGLRYLFPLMTLAFIVAYFMKGSFWKRAVLFLASIPISILMNSLRIGAIGITVERWGPSMAEGMLHDFQGWAVFMLSFAVLLLLALGLNRIAAPAGARWHDFFNFEPAPPTPKSIPAHPRRLPISLMASAALLALATVASFLLPERIEQASQRQVFLDFPVELGAWRGRRDSIDAVYLDALKLDDYAMMNYSRPGESPINFYAAYYDSQRKGESAHSPRSCIPGGGWKITDFGVRTLQLRDGRSLPVNRALIELGTNRQLVYYWFQQRGRTITNEYLVKWYIFWDALTRNRTDGALIRLTAFASRDSDVEQADQRLTDLASELSSVLPAYVPN